MNKTPLGPLAAGKKILKKRREERDRKMNVTRAPEDPSIAFSPRHFSRPQGKAFSTRESTAEKRKVLQDAERQWLSQRDGARFKVKNQESKDFAFKTPARRLNLAAFPSTAQPSGSQTPRVTSSRVTPRSRPASARDAASSARATELRQKLAGPSGTSHGPRSGSLSERLGCSIRPSPALPAGVFATPYAPRKLSEADKAKAAAETHLWYLKRSMRSMRYFELQWEFVCAEMEASIANHKEKAQIQLAEGVMATCRLQMELHKLKEIEAACEAQARSARAGQEVGAVMQDLHENRTAFVQRINRLKRSLMGALEEVPLEDGITIGHRQSPESIKKLVKYMQRALDILTAMDAIISKDGFAPKSPTKAAHGPPMQAFGSPIITAQNAAKSRVESSLQEVAEAPMRPGVQRAVEAGVDAKQTMKLVRTQRRCVKNIHSIVGENIKKQQTLTSLRMQTAQMSELVEARAKREVLNFSNKKEP
ncbi:hypothetical protein BSKO_11577 [Bryopsis sp. KO-2023]|nr:hypothetical protein BSKO_11577 [Bryopsis sp. KO-2023]